MTNKWTHSGNIIVAVFICSAIAMCILVYACMIQKTDMVSENYYDQELRFQENIDAKSNAAPFGTQFFIKVEKDSIILHVPVSLSNVLQDGTIDFYCASDSEQDKRSQLLPTLHGRYAIGTKDWKKLPYQARIHFASGSKKYYNEISINVK